MKYLIAVEVAPIAVGTGSFVRRRNRTSARKSWLLPSVSTRKKVQYEIESYGNQYYIRLPTFAS
jgi:hypothetical protein